MKFTVVIEEWATGSNSTTIQLLNSDDGMRCCLGFAAKDCGVSDGALTDIGDPSAMDSTEVSKLEGILVSSFLDNNDFTLAAMSINDDPLLDDDERIKRLSALAIEHGHEFEFIHKS